MIGRIGPSRPGRLGVPSEGDAPSLAPGTRGQRPNQTACGRRRPPAAPRLPVCLSPAEVIDRPKGYFAVPAVRHLDGPLLEHVRDVLTGPTARQRALYSPEPVARLLDEPNATRTTLGSNALWQVAALEMWLQTNGTASPQDVTRDSRWVEGLSAFYAGRYEEAVERFEELQADYRGAAPALQAKLDQARRKRDLVMWSDDADAVAGRGDWADAVNALERIAAIDATFPSANVRLEQARTAQRRSYSSTRSARCTRPDNGRPSSLPGTS